jgi:Prenyltransferase and squalene oxidase repeat
MTWQMSSTLILGLALAGGFAWYERSRPQAKVLALVAALAALAVVGRIAFAALPNVKPTTDIVLFSGFALGGAPGFAVGALSGLVSNFFFGQGPWTPWQMAGWGLVGIGGAGLGRLTRGRVPNRFVLAGVCAFAGLAYGALLDLYQLTLAAEQTTASYVAISGTSLPYNLAHAGGNAVFALLLGPGFVRALARYRRRFEVRWERPTPAAGAVACALLALCFAAVSLGAPSKASAADPAVARAVRYLERAQNSDGGFGPAPGAASTQLHTGWVALGLASGGVNPDDVRRVKRTPIDFILAGSRSLSDYDELERTTLVLRAAGMNPRRFARRNLVSELVKGRSRDGSIQQLVNRTAFEVLALRAAGIDPRSGLIRTSARWILKQQNRDGGFGIGKGSGSDVDDTGAVLEAIAVARLGRSAVPRAVRYLQRAQNRDGGFGQMRGRSSNAQSTAWAVQGLLAARRDPGRFRKGGRNPIGYLRSLQAGNGMVRYSRTSSQTPVWVTAQAVMALARKPLPLARVPRKQEVVVAKPSTAGSTTTSGAKHTKKAAQAKSGTAAGPTATTAAGTSIAGTRGEPPVGVGGPAGTVARASQLAASSPAAAQRARLAAAKGGGSAAPAIGGAALGAAALATGAWLWLRRRRRSRASTG